MADALGSKIVLCAARLEFAARTRITPSCGRAKQVKNCSGIPNVHTNSISCTSTLDSQLK